MSEYEKLNQKVTMQRAIRRKEALRKLCFLLIIIALALLLIWGLEYIKFISFQFFVILFFITVCSGSFYAGRILEGYRR